MGLDTSHDCWHGPYSAFMRWREAIAAAAEVGPLMFRMEHWGGTVPFDRSDPLTELLDHSDCDGELPAEVCGPLADRLEGLLPKLDDAWAREKTHTFITGLRLAASKDEAVDFH